MGTYESIIRMSGTIGGMTFYTRKGKACFRKKSSLDKERVSTDPAFAKSRAAGKVLGHASTLGKIIRTGFQPHTADFADGTLPQRLTQRIGNALRKLPDSLGFDFRSMSSLIGPIPFAHDKSIFTWIGGGLQWQRQQSNLQVKMPPIAIPAWLNARSGATHVRADIHLLFLGHGGETLGTLHREGDWQPINAPHATSHDLLLPGLPPDAQALIAISIQGSAECNGHYSPLRTIHAMEWVGMA